MPSVALTYAPVWRTGFIWDDDNHLTANPCSVGPLGFKEIWTTRAVDNCPLVLTTFGVEHMLWGLESPAVSPGERLAVRCMRAFAMASFGQFTCAGRMAGVALWALHTAEVESMARITEMKNTESGLFFLLSVSSLCGG
jgi:hypothetical protein